MNADPQLVKFVYDAIYAGVIGNAVYDGLKMVFQPIFGGLWEKWRKKGQKKEELEKEITEVLEKEPEKREQIENLPLYKFYQYHSGSGDNVAGDKIINNYFSQKIERFIVNGNVIIVSDKAIRKVLPHSIPSTLGKDVTDYIKVVIKSNRFGRKVEIRVPYDMTVRVFIDFVVYVLKLPWSCRIDELMILFEFSYAVIFKEDKLSLNITLREAGIVNGDEVQLSISALWRDEIKDVEQEDARRGPVMYEMSGRMKELTIRAQAQKARGILTQSKIKLLVDRCFAFVDRIDSSTIIE